MHGSLAKIRTSKREFFSRVIKEYRLYRYLFLTTIRTCVIIFFVPFLVNFFAKNYLVQPITEYLWNLKQQEIFLNSFQLKKAFTEFQEFEEILYFDSILNANSASAITAAPIQTQKSRFVSMNPKLVLCSTCRPLSVVPDTPLIMAAQQSPPSGRINVLESQRPRPDGATYVAEGMPAATFMGRLSPEKVENIKLMSSFSNLEVPNKSHFFTISQLPIKSKFLLVKKSRVSFFPISRSFQAAPVFINSLSLPCVSPNSFNNFTTHLVRYDKLGTQAAANGFFVSNTKAGFYKSLSSFPGQIPQFSVKNKNFNFCNYGGTECPPAHLNVSSRIESKLDNSVQLLSQEKLMELAIRYNKQSVQAIINIVSDFFSFVTLWYLFLTMEIQINITKSFLLEFFFGLDDTKKSLIILLITDLLVGYHSPNIWEFFLQFIFNHYGLPESQLNIFLLVATLPVLLDVLFKYLIFRHLNRTSPATVATYLAILE